MLEIVNIQYSIKQIHESMNEATKIIASVYIHCAVQSFHLSVRILQRNSMYNVTYC